MKKIRLILVSVVLAVAMISCGIFNFERTEDGLLRVETTLPLQVITSTLESAVDLSNFVNLQLELRDGYIYVQADSVEFQGITAKDVSFHIELMAVNGQLSARITNLDISGSLIDERVFESYNEMLAEQLAQASQQNDQAFLESVSISPDGVKLVWLINAGAGN